LDTTSDIHLPGAAVQAERTELKKLKFQFEAPDEIMALCLPEIILRRHRTSSALLEFTLDFRYVATF